MRFKQFYTLWENVEDEISKLERDLAMVDTNINNQLTPLQRKKDQLVKMLAIKRKQATASRQQNASQNKPGQQTTSSTTVATGII